VGLSTLHAMLTVRQVIATEALGLSVGSRRWPILASIRLSGACQVEALQSLSRITELGTCLEASVASWKSAYLD
jgi:hypothetical protein